MLCISTHTTTTSSIYIQLHTTIDINIYTMKEIRTLHYITCAIIILMMIEGMITLGNAFDFSNYTAFAWFAQGVILAFTVLTAIRIAAKVED
jgi:hypothetical protein